MAKPVNFIRNVTAILKGATVNKYGKSFAVDYDADGFPFVNVTARPVPDDIKTYLEGADFASFAVPSNVDKLCAYALSSFPALTEVYLFKNDDIVDLDDDLSYLTLLEKIYVPTALLSAYESEYTDSESPNYKANLVGKFDLIVEDYTLEIKKTDNDGDTLTEAIIQRYIDSANSQQKNAYTKVVVTGFTSYMDALWLYNFSEVLPQLNNNIWYGTTKVDFTTLTIQGSGTLTSQIVEDALDFVSSDKISGITKLVVPEDFTSIDNGALDIIDDYLGNNLTLDTSCYCTVAIYTKMTAGISNNKFSKWIWRATNCKWGRYPFNSITIDTIVVANNIINLTYSLFDGRIYLNNLYIDWTLISASGQLAYDHRTHEIQNLYLTKITNIDKSLFGGAWYHGLADNVYIEQPNVILNGRYFSIDTRRPNKIYVPATNLDYYMSAQYWADYGDIIVGKLDYTDTVPTFTDYSLTWYEDEACTISILPADFVSGHTYYAKAQWANATLNINAQSGETTLTSAIVTRELAKASSNYGIVTKVVISDDFKNSVNRDVILSASNISSLVNLNTTNDIYYAQVDYRLVDYVTLGNTTSISTGITGTQQMIYKYTVKFTSGYNAGLFSKAGINANGIGFVNTYGNPRANYWQADGYFASSSKANKKVQFIYNGDKTFTCNIENDTYTLDFTNKPDVVSGEVSFGKQPSSIYEVTIIGNNVSIYNLVPIYDVANEIYCFYESVSKTLLTNEGFTGGGNDA